MKNHFKMKIPKPKLGRKLIEQNSSYSVVFVEKVGGRLDTFALDYLTETEYKLFIKHSKPMKP